MKKQTHSSRYIVASINWLMVMLLLLSPGVVMARNAAKIPAPSAIADYKRVATAPAPIEDNSTEWWRSLNDPVLDSLETLGRENNYNLLLAARRIVLSQNSLKQLKGAYLPTFAAQAGWQAARQSGNITEPGTKAVNTSYWNAGLTMSWEIDVFGRVGAQRKSAEAQTAVTRAEAQSILLSTQAQIAQAYVQVRLCQAQLAVAQAQAASQAKVLKITQARMDVGLASRLDVEQAQTVYTSTLASVPLIDADARNAIGALAILLGQTPDQLAPLFTGPAPLPEYTQLLPAEVAMETLRQRPDVIEAEASITADLAALGVAEKEYFPIFRIDGALGTSAHAAKDLVKNHSFTYSVAPTLSWTIFDGFQRKYAIINAREQIEMDIDSYNLTMLTAVQEVDNALTTYRTSLEYVDALTQTLNHGEHALQLALESYKQGLSAFTTVVDAQMSVLTYHNNLVSAKARALTALIDFYKAIGGPWQPA